MSRGAPHGDVDSLLEHVDDPVDEHGHERDVGVAVQQIEQDRRQHHAAEQHRGRHRDRAAGFGMESGGVPVCLLDRGEDGAAVSKITLAGVSQAHRAGSPVKKTGTEPSLEFGYRPRD